MYFIPFWNLCGLKGGRNLDIKRNKQNGIFFITWLHPDKQTWSFCAYWQVFNSHCTWECARPRCRISSTFTLVNLGLCSTAALGSIQLPPIFITTGDYCRFSLRYREWCQFPENPFGVWKEVDGRILAVPGVSGNFAPIIFPKYVIVCQLLLRYCLTNLLSVRPGAHFLIVCLSGADYQIITWMMWALICVRFHSPHGICSGTGVKHLPAGR